MRIAIVTLLGAALASTAAAAESARPSPKFSILRAGTPAPAPLELGKYHGKIVALAFIDTNCSHCQALTAVLKDTAKGYAGRGVQVLECAFNDDAEHLVAGFIQRFQPNFPVGWNNRAAVMAYLQHNILDPRPLYVPHMVFLDRGGIIREDVAGEEDFFKDPDAAIRKVLEKLLKPPRSGAPAGTAKKPAGK